MAEPVKPVEPFAPRVVVTAGSVYIPCPTVEVAERVLAGYRNAGGEVMAVPKTVRQHARDRGTLGGADAQALEGALRITEDERDVMGKALRAMADHYDAQPEEGYHTEMRRLVLEARKALVYKGVIR